MLSLSLHGWEDVLIASLAGVAFFGVLVGVATWAVVKLQRVEIAASKGEFETYKLDAGKKIADANAVGEAAKASAAEANARTKEAELALEKYKQPRHLDIESFLETLKAAPPSKVEVLYVRECSDCSWVAQFIGSFLNTANWEARWAPIDEKAATSGPWRMQPSAVSVRGYPWGITVIANDISADALARPENASIKVLFEALLKSYEPAVTMAFDKELPSDLIRVVVAPKP